MTYQNFSSGSGCLICFRQYNADSCRLDFDIIKDSFKAEGYKLLTTEYKNSKQKLEYICKNGHRNFIQWHPWSRGRRCSICSGRIVKVGKRTKYTIESIKENFAEKGFVLVSDKYENWSTLLEYKCPIGHYGKISFGSWMQGNRCRACSIEKRRNNIEDIKKGFEEKGYKLLSKEYKRANLRLDYLCPSGHKNSMSWLNFRNGSECPDCVNLRNANKFRLSFETVKQSFENEGYQLLTQKYKNANQKLDFVCPNGHHHSIAWAQWNSGARCIYCFQESLSGHGNPNWRNGLSQSRYCPIWTNKEFKDYLKWRDRDKFCWNPQCDGNGKKTFFHHINYIKKDCDPINIIKICNSCNSIANFNREWWKAFYTEVMRRRFGNAK